VPADLILTAPDISTIDQGNQLTLALKISIRNSTDSISVLGKSYTFYPRDVLSDTPRITSFEFLDGTIWNLDDIRSKIISTSGHDVLIGTSKNDVINGQAGDDMLYGGAGNDTVQGGAGSDSLYDSAGSDILIGNDGDDLYYLSNPSTLLVENSDEGVDWVVIESNINTYTLPPNIENLSSNSPNDTLTKAYGNELNNKIRLFSSNADWQNGFYIYGLGGDDEISGAQFSYGGQGNDLYWIENANQRIFENENEGSDTVSSSVSYTLPSNVENLSLVGLTWDPINGTGNELDNVLVGSFVANVLTGDAGNDTLDGAEGADTLVGGTGNDTYIFVDAADTIVENSGEGIDSVQSAVTYTLVANVENLTLTGTKAINATGNTLNNVIAGNSAANLLKGGLGDDTYYVGTGDTVTENASEGIDTVVSNITWTLGNNLENLVLTGTTAINGTGNTLTNILTGNGAANTLDGGAGADTLIGGAGNDIYVVDNVADVISENANEGADQVNSSVTYTLSVNVENLTLTGTASINGTGNALANTLTGNVGNNVLDGGIGADTMVGGAGNDTYVVDSPLDVVTELASAGTDLINSSVSYTLPTNVEKLSLTGTSEINATGNSAANILFGNSRNNTLDGGTGADSMSGGNGNDIYIVDNAGDVVTENVNEGNDQVKSSITYTLIANLEALLLTGTTAINGTGNSLNNLLVGNTANNTLNGSSGNDILQGVAGNDTLTDTSGNNIFDGGTGIDTVAAGIGNDFIAGGAGNDAITTGTGADVIAFNRGDGMDVVNASTVKDNTLSLGNGIKYADLLFKKSANDLILVTGTNEQITLKDWYANVNNHSIANLQIVIEGTTDYIASSTNKLNNKKIEQFNFDGLVSAFDQARVVNPNLTSWALSSSLTNFYINGSDTTAIGGDLAYQYATTGSLSSFSMTPAVAVVSNPQFGISSQSLQPSSSLKDTTVSLL
jgi:Ca2+-binding RTX toxin-like protein